jgi:hypothetical protein
MSRMGKENSVSSWLMTTFRRVPNFIDPNEIIRL